MLLITYGMEVSQVPHHRRKLHDFGVLVHDTALFREVIMVHQDLIHDIRYIEKGLNIIRGSRTKDIL